MSQSVKMLACASIAVSGEFINCTVGTRVPNSAANGGNTFVGFYVDVSDLKPGREYPLEVTLPVGLKPGQLQGVFFENVETEYTDKVDVQ